jgi:hypothetical protein
MKTEIARGWGVKTNILGDNPKLRCCMRETKAIAKEHAFLPYDRPVRVVLLPLAEYRRLKRIEKENAK